MKRLLLPASTLLLLLLPIQLPKWAEGSPGPRLPGPLEVVRGTVGPRSTLAAELDGVVSPARLYELVESARPVYDLARIGVGHRFGVALDPQGAVVAFTYRIDELRTLRVLRKQGDLEARIEERHYQSKIATASGVIRSSLFTAVTDAGEDDQLALDLADIFAWDVDFNTELREGDSFRVAVEKLYLDGQFRRYGPVLAAELRRGDRVFRAIRFVATKGPGYYAPDGTPLRKAFLRSPLKFTRISSRFTRARYHPILKIVRPHLGVDYAAPTGTPVHASADGVVTYAGWKGGFGKAVMLRHANGFTTLYGHLSRIAVRRGQRVSQGTRIGNVGMTGMATGPHLDYRMKRNGVFVNPLTVQSPPAAPLSAEERAVFLKLRDGRLALLPPPVGDGGPTAAD